MSINNNKTIKYNNYLLIIITCSILLCSPINSTAQQIPVYSQYTFNPFLLNPAAAGAEGFTSISLTNRNQWVGIEDAPKVYSASVQTRLMKQSHINRNASVRNRNKARLRNGRVGLGLNVYNFHAGQIAQNGAQISYAYHFQLRRQSQFSMGMSLGYLSYVIDTKELTLTNATDDPIYNSIISLSIPDANIGFYYTDRNKYFGLSILQILQASINFSISENSEFVLNRQYSLIGGYIYDVNDQDVLESSIFLKTTDQLRFQLDASLKYIYNNKFWLGLGYRSGMTFVGSTGLIISRFYFGYSFDFSTKGLLNYSYGSHEVMLALKLGDNVRRYRFLDRY
ncbi:MAG: type IX secretion system membrane protein PorP/SprF [Bacteroidales bacterium]|nr:type IX secretion system membrane protein PorP/SprF [Bacteroidales bacterium]